MDGPMASMREEPRFYGRFRLKLDAKGRVTLPAVYRRALGFESGPEGEAAREAIHLILRRGAQGFVQVIPYETWDRVSGQRPAPNATTGVDRQWRARQRFSGVDSAGLDPKGRLTVPQPFLEAAGLSGDVLVVGTRQLMEIWDPETFFRLEAELPAEDSTIDDELYG